MTNQKKLSRREAIKILGATAGASVLANIPDKWSKPELKGSNLPAHAQTSICNDLEIRFGTNSVGTLSYDTLPADDGGSANPAVANTTGVWYWGCDSLSDICFSIVSTSGGGSNGLVLISRDGTFLGAYGMANNTLNFCFTAATGNIYLV